MQEYFDLETILSVTTGINLTDDFNKIFDLYKFVYNDPYITTTCLGGLRRNLIIHLLTIHPELRKNFPNLNKERINDWLIEQKLELGSRLPISRIGEELESSHLSR